jgi:hypothetical protein
MKDKISSFINTKKSKTIFLLSLLVSIICILGRTINVYQFAVVGAIFEIMWLPVLATLFLLPIFSLIFLLKEKINVRSLYIYSILINVATICFMIFGK